MHWLKLWTKGWLEGSIRFDLSPAQRSVFIDLCAMARESRNPPWVQANETTAYPHSWLASKLNIPLELLEETLKICKVQERVTENSVGIQILKFDFYQGEQLSFNNNPDLAELIKIYESEIGLITPMAAEQIKDIAQTYSLEWFREAVAEAVKANVRRLSYVQSILERWTTEGFKSQKPTREGAGGGTHRQGDKRPPSKTPTHYTDPDALRHD